PGFRVAHYSIQDDHAHFLIEAAGARRLANGMKSLAARFARCVNRVFGRKGRVLAGRFHHVLKRTPTEVRRALAPGSAGGPGRREFGAVVRRLEGPRSAAGPLRGRGPGAGGGGTADVAAGQGLAADRAGGSGRGAGDVTAPSRAAASGNGDPSAAGFDVQGIDLAHRVVMENVGLHPVIPVHTRPAANAFEVGGKLVPA
ncbi:MAG: hypothetical protein OXH15_08810, partial [Gammaproteobacteria bacterium]|nr:hypothetical protein [Gammaproteobacteria bacterium]